MNTPPDELQATHNMKTVTIEVVSSAEGQSLVVNDHRVCGPKSNGRVLRRWCMQGEAFLKEVDTATGGEITRLRATIAELREEREWRPISTAPVNESVLVYIRNAEHYGEGIYRAMQVDMGTGRRWMTTGLGIGRDVRRDGPTHWLPLPQPPDASRQPSSGREG